MSDTGMEINKMDDFCPNPQNGSSSSSESGSESDLHIGSHSGLDPSAHSSFGQSQFYTASDEDHCQRPQNGSSSSSQSGSDSDLHTGPHSGLDPSAPGESQFYIPITLENKQVLEGSDTRIRLPQEHLQDSIQMSTKEDGLQQEGIMEDSPDNMVLKRPQEEIDSETATNKGETMRSVASLELRVPVHDPSNVKADNTLGEDVDKPEAPHFCSHFNKPFSEHSERKVSVPLVIKTVLKKSEDETVEFSAQSEKCSGNFASERNENHAALRAYEGYIKEEEEEGDKNAAAKVTPTHKDQIYKDDSDVTLRKLSSRRGILTSLDVLSMYDCISSLSFFDDSKETTPASDKDALFSDDDPVSHKNAGSRCYDNKGKSYYEHRKMKQTLLLDDDVSLNVWEDDTNFTKNEAKTNEGKVDNDSIMPCSVDNDSIMPCSLLAKRIDADRNETPSWKLSQTTQSNIIHHTVVPEIEVNNDYDSDTESLLLCETLTETSEGSDNDNHRRGSTEDTNFDFEMVDSKPKKISTSAGTHEDEKTSHYELEHSFRSLLSNVSKEKLLKSKMIKNVFVRIKGKSDADISSPSGHRKSLSLSPQDDTNFSKSYIASKISRDMRRSLSFKNFTEFKKTPINLERIATNTAVHEEPMGSTQLTVQDEIVDDERALLRLRSESQYMHRHYALLHSLHTSIIGVLTRYANDNENMTKLCETIYYHLHLEDGEYLASVAQIAATLASNCTDLQEIRQKVRQWQAQQDHWNRMVFLALRCRLLADIKNPVGKLYLRIGEWVMPIRWINLQCHLRPYLEDPAAFHAETTEDLTTTSTTTSKRIPIHGDHTSDPTPCTFTHAKNSHTVHPIIKHVKGETTCTCAGHKNLPRRKPPRQFPHNVRNMVLVNILPHILFSTDIRYFIQLQDPHGIEVTLIVIPTEKNLKDYLQRRLYLSDHPKTTQKLWQTASVPQEDLLLATERRFMMGGRCETHLVASWELVPGPAGMATPTISKINFPKIICETSGSGLPDVPGGIKRGDVFIDLEGGHPNLALATKDLGAVSTQCIGHITRGLESLVSLVESKDGRLAQSSKLRAKILAGIRRDEDTLYQVTVGLDL